MPIFKFSQKIINFSKKLVDKNCCFKDWEIWKNQYLIKNITDIQWVPLVHSIPQTWKENLKKNESKNDNTLLILKHHLIRNKRILTSKLTATEIYSLFLSLTNNKPTLQKYFQKIISNNKFNWEQIYMLLCMVTINSYQQNVQYEILHNILKLTNCILTKQQANN